MLCREAGLPPFDAGRPRFVQKTVLPGGRLGTAAYAAAVTRFWAVLAAGWFVASLGLAQAEPQAQVSAEQLTPPRLIRFVEAEYPAAEKAAGLEAAVDLQVSIGADGLVSDVQVIESAGEAFDQAAVAAVRQFVFEPARRDWEPVPSRLRYRYLFELEREPEELSTGWLSGRLLYSKDDKPAAGVAIELSSQESGELRDLVTGPDGSFIVTDLPPGAYRVRVIRGTSDDISNVEEIAAGQVTEVTYRLGDLRRDDAGYEGFGATAVIDPPSREVVQRTIGEDELTSIPGTRGDALRAIEILPGVARPPFGIGLLIVRGSAPQDSETFLEGIPIPLLYHFGGLTSVINSRLLEEIDFVPGNFSGRYGRRTGGIVEVRTRDPAQDRWHGIAELSVIDTYVLAEGPITDKVSIALAARRSLIDLVFSAVAPDGIRVESAPVYYDYQLFLTWKPTPKDRLRFLTYGSNDRFEILFEEAEGDDPAIRGNAGLLTRFNFFQMNWARKIRPNIEQEIDLMAGPAQAKFALQEDFLFDGNFLQTYGRGEWRAQVSDRVQIISGLDLFFTPAHIQYTGPQPQQSEGGGSQQRPVSGEEQVFVDTRQLYARPGLYLESSMSIGDFTSLRLMTRLDYFSAIREFAFDPRANVAFSLREDMRLKFGLGLYSQPPEFQESSADIGNPDLEPIQSVHAGAGYEIDPIPGMMFSVEGFYKYLWDRVVVTPNGEPPFYSNAGIGRIYGAEFAAHLRPTTGEGEGARRYFGYLSYTLSRSERKDGPNEPWRLFDYDQTHILTAAFVYRFNRGWELGGTFRLVSGNPYTPVVGSVYDALNDVYIPIDGQVNSQRNPLFNRLDLRVQKTWTFDQWKLALFLDIQNLYNQKNPEGEVYNYDFSERSVLTGLPIIPSLGLRGEL
jgi:TonB family protein